MTRVSRARSLFSDVRLSCVKVITFLNWLRDIILPGGGHGPNVRNELLPRELTAPPSPNSIHIGHRTSGRHNETIYWARETPLKQIGDWIRVPNKREQSCKPFSMPFMVNSWKPPFRAFPANGPSCDRGLRRDRSDYSGSHLFKPEHLSGSRVRCVSGPLLLIDGNC